MPVIYSIDYEKKIIRTTCTEPIDEYEVTRHFEELENDNTCPEKLDVLLDLSKIKSIPEAFQLRTISNKIINFTKIQFRNCAIVTSSNVMYGMFRMFAVFVEKRFQVIEVFRNYSEAEFWLMQRNNATPITP